MVTNKELLEKLEGIDRKIKEMDTSIKKIEEETVEDESFSWQKFFVSILYWASFGLFFSYFFSYLKSGFSDAAAGFWTFFLFAFLLMIMSTKDTDFLMRYVEEKIIKRKRFRKK